jgi:hypothetical protein
MVTTTLSEMGCTTVFSLSLTAAAAAHLGSEIGRTLRQAGLRLLQVYFPAEDVYRCPAGDRLTYRHEHLLEAVQGRLGANPQAVRQRRETVEPPFGTIKMRMGATHFLMKGLPRVVTEMALHVLAYNITRVLNIIDARSPPNWGLAIRVPGTSWWFVTEPPPWRNSMGLLVRLVALIIAITSVALFATMFGATSIKYPSSAHAADSGDGQKYAARKRRPAVQKGAGPKKERSAGSSCWAECVAEAYRSNTAKGCNARCADR